MHLNMSTKTFNSNDLNKEFWLPRAYKEAKLIYENKNTRGYNVKTGKPRTFSEVKETTEFGHAPECWLLEQEDFTDDKRRYKDLMYKNIPVEIKTVTHKKNIDAMLQKCAEFKKEIGFNGEKNWRQFPDYVLMFIGNWYTLNYTFYKIYKWNGSEFI